MVESHHKSSKTILEFAQAVKEMGTDGVVKEFHQIPRKTPEVSYAIAEASVNLKRNRHPYLLSADKYRVALLEKTGEGEQVSDFINANFVDGYEQENAYIATQGPLPSTTADFWQMIWEQKCLVIVMATGLIEEDDVKCHQYWEENPGESIVYGNYEVRTFSVKSNDGYTVSSLELTNLMTDETRKVAHFYCFSWPDLKAPMSSEVLLKYQYQIRESQSELLKSLGDSWTGHPRGPPIVVHCSAGIGRTGAFILLDISILRLEDVGTVDVPGILEKIRRQRPLSIGMPSQYAFVHRALLEYALNRKLLSFDIDLDELNNHEHHDAKHLLAVNAFYKKALEEDSKKGNANP